VSRPGCMARTEMELKEGNTLQELQTVSRHDLEAEITKRCWQDEAFRKEFTADPGGAFNKYLDIPAASFPKIFMHQEATGSWHIVLPAKPANARQLTEEELEKVAGGVTGMVPLSFAVSAAAVSAATSAGITVATALLTQGEGGW
jgi:hypothetical protein